MNQEEFRAMGNGNETGEVIDHTSAKKPIGFAKLDKEKLFSIAQKGGLAAHAHGKAHEWNSETARSAALKAAANRTAKAGGK